MNRKKKKFDTFKTFGGFPRVRNEISEIIIGQQFNAVDITD